MANKAKLDSVLVESPEAEKVRHLRRQAINLPPFSQSRQITMEALSLAERNLKPAETAEEVTLTMPREQAEKLYGLLGQITRHSGFDPIFQSLNNAPFTLVRRRPKLHFVSDNVLTAEF